MSRQRSATRSQRSSSSTGKKPTDEPSYRFEATTGKVALTANEPFLLPVENPPFDPLLPSRTQDAAACPGRRFACATRSTATMSLRSPASSAAGRPRKPITFGSPSLARWGARSATNTRSPSAGSITANCIAMVTRPHGGPVLRSIRCQLRSNCGSDRDQRLIRGPWYLISAQSEFTTFFCWLHHDEIVAVLAPCDCTGCR